MSLWKKVEKYFTECKTKPDDSKKAMAVDLKQAFENEFKDITTESQVKLMNFLCDSTIKAYRSTDLEERKTGMILMFFIIDLEINDYGLKLRCLKEVTNFSSSQDIYIMILNASIFVKYVQIRFMTSDMFDYEIKKAKKYFADEQSDRKTYTLVLYNQCSSSIPAMFFPYILDSFHNISSCIGKATPIISKLVVSLIHNCFKIFIPREDREPRVARCYDILYKTISIYFLPYHQKNYSDDEVLCSIMALRELIRISSAHTLSRFNEITNAFMACEDLKAESSLETDISKLRLTSDRFLANPASREGAVSLALPLSSKLFPATLEVKYDVLLNFLLKQLYSKISKVVRISITLITLLAGFDKNKFTKKYLSMYFQSFVSLIKSNKEPTTVYLSFAVALCELGRTCEPYVTQILDCMNYSCKENPERRKNVAVDPMLLACLSCLSKYCQDVESEKVGEILRYILENTPLSPAVITTLVRSREELSNYNQLVACLVQRILDNLKSSKLMAKDTALYLSTPDDVNQVILSLRSIRILEISCLKVCEMLYDSSQMYLDSPQKTIRLEAVKTCCQIISSLYLDNAKSYWMDSEFGVKIQTTLDRLVQVGISDIEPDIRLFVLTYLSDYNQSQLCRVEILSLLSLGLYDECLDIRRVVIRLLGNLSTQNPAFLNNILEKYYLESISAFMQSTQSRNTVSLASNIHALISSCPYMAHNCMDSLLTNILPMISSPGMSSEFLSVLIITVSDLSFFCAKRMIKYIPDYIDALVQILTRPGLAPVKGVAVDSLISVLLYTGYFEISIEKYQEIFSALLALLKIEQAKSVRWSIINAFGCLGARDPYKLFTIKSNIGTVSKIKDSEVEIKPWREDQARKNVCEILQLHSSTDKMGEFYSGVCINIVSEILLDPSQQAHHSHVVQILQDIYTSNSSNSFQYLSLLMPTYIAAVGKSEPDMKKIILEQIGKLIQSSKNKPFPYVEELFTLAENLWVDPSSPVALKSSIIKIIEYLVNTIPTESSYFLPNILTKATHVFLNDVLGSEDNSEENQLITLLLSALQRLAPSLCELMYFIVPALIRVFNVSNLPIPLQTLAISTLHTIFNLHDASDYTSPTIHALIRILETKPLLHNQALGLLVLLFEKYSKKMLPFISSVKQALIQAKIVHPPLETAMIIAIKCPYGTLGTDQQFNNQHSISSVLQQRKEDFSMPVVSNYAPNSENLLRAFQTTQRVRKVEWIDWLNRITLELVKESPSIFVRYCAVLSQSYSSIGRSLLHYSFFSCWKEISYSCRESITKCLIQSLELENMNEVVLPILNLVEFLEHTDCDQLMITPKKLAECAYEASAYVKALRYTEKYLRTSDDIDTLQSLLSINILLNSRDAAEGVLAYAVKKNLVDFAIQQPWFEKLHDWQNALVAYENQIIEEPSNIQLQLGRMRCLEALCEWKELDNLVSQHWPKVDGEEKIEISKLGSYCSLGLGMWDKFKNYSKCIPRERFEGSYLRAIVHVKSDQLQLAKMYLDDARDLMESELATVLSESYNRSYRSLMKCQMLTELEEIINYKLFPTHRETIKDIWRQRLKTCKRITYDWQRLLDQRTLVLPPKENLDSWLKFSNISRKRGRTTLCKNVFEKLLTQEEIFSLNAGNIPNINPYLVLNYIRFMWSSDNKHQAYMSLNKFASLMVKPRPDGYTNIGLEPEKSAELLSKLHLQLGLWNTSNFLQNQDINTARENFISATRYNKKSYKAWCAWANFNYEIVLSYVQDNKIPKMSSIDEKTDSDVIKSKTSFTDAHVANTYVLPAIGSFFKCIKLSEENSFQHTLRLFTLWFEYGELSDVLELLNKEIKNVKVDNWLQVIPQLIARLDTPKIKVRTLICKLLAQIASIHPQAIIYPLMVSAISGESVRKNTAKDVLQTISTNFPDLVQQATVMSNELIRVSILWYEECYSVIEEASRLFFNDSNIPSSLQLLDKIHLKIMHNVETPTEISFLQNYQGLFNDALYFRNRYASSNDCRDLTQAWTVYYQIFKLLAKKIEMIESIDLRNASPTLLTSQNLILSMPGTYKPHSDVIFIQKVDPLLKVIGSKQKPRKITMRGSDGRKYEYLLKGHEDLRQDERVMQLFGLLNNILKNNHPTFKRKLNIRQYSVTPLSTNSGLIGWVSNCDTLNSLIKEQRIKAKIDPMIENKMILKYCPKYESLDFLHKLEFFEMITEATNDNELADSLWQKSTSSEIWFEKRTNFIRSLSLMSMVGYILGLGDRHPLNIMQELTTGQIIHIDFGDCFEVAMKREHLPEKVPFRLTRMLTKCVEVTGIDGTFRVTSVCVMDVLRNNKDSLLAALEAFIYDPLLSWRLLDHSSSGQESASSLRNRHGLERKNSSYELTTANSYHQNSSTSFASSERNSHAEILNKKAISVVNRIKDKLNGCDFYKDQVVSVEAQVGLLIEQATSIENISQSYLGWYYSEFKIGAHSGKRSLVF